MPEEFIDILNKEGIETGKSCLKSEIHTKGHYHNTAHIWFYTRKGEILLAQRDANKMLHPLLWDVSVAGHIDAGESIEQGAIREIKEEIDLTISENDLFKIGVFDCFQSYENGIVDNEFHHTYLVELKVALNQLSPQKGEVGDLKFVTIDAFKDILNSIGENNHLVPSNKAYYEYVLEAIIKKMT